MYDYSDLGCYIDGHIGQRAADVRLLHMAADHGFTLDAQALEIIARHEDDARPEDDDQILSEIALEAEAWLTEHAAPPGCSWTWSDGDFGLWLETEDDSLIIESRAHAEAYLMLDGDLGTPGCEYGSRTSDCVPFAIAVADIFADSSGDAVCIRDLDSAMGLVVNSHDDVRSLLIAHGSEQARALLEDVGSCSCGVPIDLRSTGACEWCGEEIPTTDDYR